MSQKKPDPHPASQTRNAQALLAALESSDATLDGLLRALSELPGHCARGVKSQDGKPILGVAMGRRGEAANAPPIDSERLALIRKLLEAGADPNDSDSKGRRPLHLALSLAASGSERGPTDALCKILLEAGADPGALDDTGQSSLHVACKLGDAALIDLFATHGADIDQPLPGTLSRPAHLAAMSQSVPAMDALLRLGADFSARDAQGLDPAGMCMSLATELARWGAKSEPALRTALEIGAKAERQQLDRASGLGAAPAARAPRI